MTAISWGPMRCVLTALACATLVLPSAGCSAEDLPLPGGVDTGPDPYHVTVEFRDVLDLVPRSAVKVDDVDVGEVEEIWLDGYVAKVRLRIRGSVRLPDNATARIRQTSLLGEKFVSLAAPPSADGVAAGYGRLDDGDVIPLSRTGRNAEVEEVLSALSLLLNGGGVAQLKTITTELNRALEGREESVREVLRQLNTMLAELDENKREIVRALEELDRLAARLAKERAVIGAALEDIPAALTVLADQRRQLTRMLVELSELGEVGTRVVRATGDELQANLRDLAPILTRLAEAGDALPKSLQLLFTYPFSDATVNAVRGDYTNLQLTLDADLKTLLEGKGLVQLPEDLRVDLDGVLPTVCVPPLVCPEQTGKGTERGGSDREGSDGRSDDRETRPEDLRTPGATPESDEGSDGNGLSDLTDLLLGGLL